MSSQQVTTFMHGPSGREIEKQLDNETRTVTAYDAAGQPLVVSNLESNNSVISRFTYTYDPFSNRVMCDNLCSATVACGPAIMP
ncbi:MAG: hypothetical protein KDA90_22610, partial [Planctomycetaceae bacterium]|nr:hypothetical protein [Planctomycetaceae bacterium]